MADVKTNNCFPTLIHEFKLDLDHDKMLDYIESNLVTTGQMQQTTNVDLHKLLVFKPLVDEFDLLHESILRKLEYEFDKIEITNMWSNRLYSGDSHPPHTHSNNFLSGVYYLHGGTGGVDTSPIQFFDPRPQAIVLRPRNKVNWNNGSMVQINFAHGTGLIFPSWLQHWVPATKHERISLAWNMLVRGHYGEPNTLQNAYI